MTGYESKRAAAQDKLAQPAQEPVAWMWRCKPYYDYPNWEVSLKRPADSGRDGNKKTDGYEDVPLYAAPPQPAQEPTLQEQLDRANADLGKAKADYIKADADWDKAVANQEKSIADWDKAYADLCKAVANQEKAEADWEKANAEIARIEKLIEEANK